MRLQTPTLACLALLLAACAPPQSLQPASGGPAIAGDGSCKAEGLAWAVGEQAPPVTMARAWRESAAGLTHPIAPGQAVTREFRSDRVHVSIDDAIGRQSGTENVCTSG